MPSQMSDAPRQPEGIPGEPDRKTTDVGGGSAPAAPTTPAAPETPTAPEPARAHDASPAPGARTDTSPGPGARGGGLLPHDASDELSRRLHHAVTGFVDAPRASVEEADRVLEEIAARLTDAVAQRHRTLRTSWQGTGEDSDAPSTDTEQLRLALRDYRELADRLTRAFA